MRQLEEENLRLKRLVADLRLDKAMLQVITEKRADAGTFVRTGQGFTGSITCQRITEMFCAAAQPQLISISFRGRPDSALWLRNHEIAETRCQYGYRRVHVMLRREGWRDNHKGFYSLYCKRGLSMCLKRPHHNKLAQR